MPADLYTPVGIYLRLRDKFRDTILLESADHHSAENSFSFIGINAIGGIEIKTGNEVEYKYPLQKEVKLSLSDSNVPSLIWDYMNGYQVSKGEKETRFAQGLFGYTAYDAIPYFENIQFQDRPYQTIESNTISTKDSAIPVLRYRLYQYVIAIDHFRDQLYLLENKVGIAGRCTIPGKPDSRSRSASIPFCNNCSGNIQHDRR